MASAPYIRCPDCNTEIPFDPYELVRGTKFACPKCSVAIGIDQSSRDTVKDALDKLGELKREAGRGDPERQLN